MQDELLIRFIDGKCTREESEKAIEELSRDGNGATEWLQMVAATRLADSEPVRPVSSADARGFVSGTMARTAETLARRRRIIRWASVTAGLCAVAASIAITVVIRTGNGSMNMNDHLLASSRDSVIYAKPESEAEEVRSETKEDKIAEKGDTGAVRSVKSSDALNPDERQAESYNVSKEYAGQETVPQSVVSVVYDSNASKVDVSDSTVSSRAKQESAALERELEMIHPLKSPYRVEVENLSKDFVFEWKCDGEADARLVVIDRENTVLVDKTADGPERNKIRIPIKLITDKGELVWTLEITFPDGDRVSRTGRISLKSDID